MPSFDPGDRVRCIRAYDNNDDIRGAVGTVYLDDEGLVHVHFDEPIRGGHTDNGNCAPGHGWNVPQDYLEPITGSGKARVRSIGEFFRRLETAEGS